MEDNLLRLLLATVLIFTCTFRLCANQIIPNESDSTKGITYFNKGVSVFKNNLDSAAYFFETAASYLYNSGQFANYVDCYNALHKIAVIKENYRLAKSFALKSWNLAQELLVPENLVYARSMQNLGALYENEGFTEKALELIHSSLELQLTSDFQDTASIIQMYKNLGIIYGRQRRFQKSLEQYGQGMSLLKEYSDQQKLSFASLLHHIGKVHNEMGKDSLATQYLDEAIEIFETVDVPSEGKLLLSCYNNMILVKSRQQLWHETPIYKNKAISLLEKYNLNGHYLFWVLAKHAVETGNYQEAEVFLNSALGSIEQHFSKGSTPIRKGITFLSYSTLYMKQGLFKKSLEYLKITYEVFAPADSFDHPTYDKMAYKTRGIEVLGVKGEVYWTKYKVSRKVEDLYHAFETFKQVRALIKEHRKEVEYEADKVFFARQVKKNHERTLEVLYELYQQTKNTIYLEEAWTVMEENKASVMYEAMSDSNAKFGLPDSLREEEQSLKIYIHRLEKKIFDLQQAHDSTALTLAKSQLFNLRNDYSDLIKHLEISFPKYYQEKYKTVSMSITDVQSKLSGNEGIISYFLGEDQLFTLFITPENMGLFKEGSISNFENLVNKYHDGLSQYRGSETDSLLFSTSHLMYRTLLEQPLKNMGNQVLRLKIITDDILGYIPFETLLETPYDSQKAYKELDYVLKHYALSYLSSAKEMLDPFEAKDNRTHKLWLGIAPHYSDEQLNQLSQASVSSSFLATRSSRTTDRVSQLPFSKDEVNQLADIVSGNTLIGAMASESSFIDQCTDYAILHLATHGLVNEHNALYHKLIFAPETDSIYDGELHTYEIYNLSLTTDMVVLSACNTGVGQLAKGEGIMSLTRAFTYAGSKSIINTLWQISDRSSATLMTYFYKYLKKGYTKDEALRLAKLEYLAQVKEPYLGHPYFWSSYIASGDMSPLDLDRKWKNYLPWSIAVFAVALFVFFRYRHSQV